MADFGATFFPRVGCDLLMPELSANPLQRTNPVLRTDTRIGGYCAVSVNVTCGCPSAYWPSAVTCTVPAVAGSVSVTDALPVESVVTIRLESVPPVAVKNTVAPDALPPDCPGFIVTLNVIGVPAFAF